MFSGIGGFELGIQKALGDQAECVGYSEVDKHAISIYNKHFKEHKNYGDATKINPAQLPDFELLVGGFPCQAFSIAGKRRGFRDTRGTLFFEIARIAREKQPRLLVLENVKGLLSHDQRRTYLTIIATLDELGYDTQRITINSSNHGVPQSRERVYIIGYLRGKCRQKVLLIKKSNRKNTKLPKYQSHTITARYGQDIGVGSYIGEQKKVVLKQIIGGSQGARVYDASGLACTQASGAGGLGAKTGPYAIKTKTKTNTFIDNFLVDDTKAQLFMVDGNVYMADDTGVYEVVIRKLTPKECERLQGFPDNWTKYGKDGELISDTQRYKCCGNAVTANVVEFIISNLIKL
jgi:DNA (cytosine-5)-methyltransferase 1